MQVRKRDGRLEKVSFDKILFRIQTIKEEKNLDRVDAVEITKETIQGLCPGITTEELDVYASLKCAERIIDDPQYNTLAAALAVSNIHKTTPKDYMEVITKLLNNVDTTRNPIPLINDQFYNFAVQNIDRINSALDYNRDYMFDFFGIRTLEKSYLLRTRESEHFEQIKSNKKEINEVRDDRTKYGKVVERPQHMIMRLALAIHHDDIDAAIETYDLVSQGYFTHASPSLFNAGSKVQQMSSCFLLGMRDSIEGIFDETICDTVKIIKYSGGIGIHLQDIRSKGSLIRSTGNYTSSIVHLVKVLNAITCYINQGRRNGAMALYIEPWHYDIFEFCEIRKNSGDENARARNVFPALWIPDLFMKRVENGEHWSLMCPDECPGLTDVWGEDFERLYEKYENEGRYRKQIQAIDLWNHILAIQIETGTPYMTFKDTGNRLSNQQNAGIIKSSNLCTEIFEISNENEIGVCNLGSICLQRFIEKKEDGTKYYDYDKLRYIAYVLTRNLNKVIDINFYPVPKTKVSNMRHRPIGVGVQGLADVFAILEIPFDSEEARDVNKRIFETIYYGCLKASMEIAKKEGPYETFEGSPFSKGQLQFHLWGLNEDDLLMGWDWKSLIADIKKYGTRNSLLTTVMPTATTSQIMSSNECIESYTTNLYTRTTLAGEYIVMNKYLVEKLIELNLWNKEMKNKIIYDNGSIQKIKEIPEAIREVYKTSFEMKTKPPVQLAIDRGPFIDQSQSLNIFMREPDFNKLTSSHFYAWKNQLKTGMYYLRVKLNVNAIKFGLDPEFIERIEKERTHEVCEMCSA